MGSLDFLDKLFGVIDEVVFPLLAAYVVFHLRSWLAGATGRPRPEPPA